MTGSPPRPAVFPFPPPPPTPGGFGPGGGLPLPPPPPPTLAPPPPPPELSGTFRAVGTVRTSLSYFRIVLLLLALTAVVSAASYSTFSVGTVLGEGPHAPPLNNQTLREIANQSSQNLGFVVVGGLVGTAALVLEIVAYLRWREGLKELEATAWEYGAGHMRTAGDADSARRYGFGTYLVQLVVGAIAAVAVFEIIFQVGLSGTPGGVPLTPDQLSMLQDQLRETVVTAGLLTGVLNVALYFLAGRSHALAVESIASPEERQDLLWGRYAFVGGAALTILGAFTVYNPYAAIGAIAGPLVVALGVTWMLRAYDAWLFRPPMLRPVGRMSSGNPW